MVIIKAFHSSNKKEKTKVHVDERKDFFFLYIVNEENFDIIKDIEKNLPERKKLISFLKDSKDKFVGYCIAEVKKDKVYFLNYGETNVGYSSGTDYEYIEDEDTVNQHFVKTFLLASPAYVCKKTDFSIENATIKSNRAKSYIEWIK